MYETFFNLQKNPFGMTPDPSCMFMTASHREALAGLMYAIFKRKGFVVLTGDAGTGKTTLLRSLIRSSSGAQFGMILNPTLTLDEFLELVLFDFGISEVPRSKAQRIVKLQELLADFHQSGKVPVLIVDEAHKVSPEVLEEIRLLTNFETTEQKLLQIVLAGQSELGGVLNREDLRQLKQRIELRLELKPLSLSDIGLYMQHRWERAGGAATELPFVPETLPLIAKASHGIPRLVNSICDNALLLAYGDGAALVTVKHISQVMKEFDLMDSSAEAAPKAPAVPAPSNGHAAAQAPARNGAPTLSTIPTLDRYCTEMRKPSLIMRWMRKMSLGEVQPTRSTSQTAIRPTIQTMRLGDE